VTGMDVQFESRGFGQEAVGADFGQEVAD
jgi:hypothetical protein